MRPFYYILNADRSVESVESAVEWAIWAQKQEAQGLGAHRHVASTVVHPDGSIIEIWPVEDRGLHSVWISTVFTGRDHRFFTPSLSRPLLFETMVFGGALDSEQCLTSTWLEAEAKHKEIVAGVRTIVLDEAKTAVGSQNP